MRSAHRKVLILAIIGLASMLADRAPAASGHGAVPDDWLKRVTSGIERSEYRFSPAGVDVWSAPNRAHDLRARIDEEGIEMTSRTRGAAAWKLSLRLTAFGREGAMRSVPPARPAADGDRIRLDRGDIVEWYANDPRGLEQGFTIEGPPPDGESAQPLVIEMSLAGGVTPSPGEDGGEILFLDAAGAPVVRYAELLVTDAAGRRMEARLAAGSDRVRILVQDEEAVYPVTVDPLATLAAWTKSSLQADAIFGYSVATAGDVNGDGYSDIIIGAPYYDNGESNEGRAYLYYGHVSGPGGIEDWKAESNAVFSHFGYSVATAGDVNGDGFDDILIGTPDYSNVQFGEGAAFLWLGGATGPGADGTPSNADWHAESDESGAGFGTSLSTAGDVNGNGRDDVIVGCPECDNGTTDEGRAFLYLGVAGGLAVIPVWTAESNQAGVRFGISVSTAGDVNADGYSDVIIGCPDYNNGSAGEGAAFVWFGGASFGSGADGNPTNASWYAEANQLSALLGYSVANAGDVNGDGYADVILGAPYYDDPDSAEGLALVFYGEPGGLGPIGTPLNADWKAGSDVVGAVFAERVATAGDVNGDGYADVIIGDRSWDNGETSEGAAFMWQGGPAGPGATGTPSNADWKIESNEVGALYGFAVATAGDTNGDGYSDVIVGAPQADFFFTDDGKALLYRGSPSGLTTAAAWTAEPDQATAHLGFSVAMAGDTNGDGFTEILVGAPLYDAGQTNEGRVFLFIGGHNGPGPVANWTAESDKAEAQLGYSVAPAGDVNGDGYSDVLIGAPFYEKNPLNEGGAFVWFGGVPDILNPSGLGPDGTPINADWSFTSGVSGAALGFSVAGAGDVNRDGYSDVILGAPTYTNVEGGEGAAWVFLGSAAGPAGLAWFGEGNQAGAHFGASVAMAGDVNRDGHTDVLIGAPLWDGASGLDEGRAFLYLGKGGGVDSTVAWSATSAQAGAQLGYSVAPAGDVNRDSFSDVIVGAPYWTNGETDEGAVFLWRGSTSNLGPDGDPNNADWSHEGGQATALLGYAVSSAGDVDADGFSDVIVGMPEYTNVETQEGRALLFRGGPGGVNPLIAWNVQSNQTGSRLGNSLAGEGDVNGDGFGDVIVGAWLYNNGQIDEGRAFMYYGGGGEGLHRIPRQARSDDTQPIDILGKTNSISSFRLKALGRSAAGRASVRLEWEVKELRGVFDGTGIGQGIQLDTGAPSFLDGSAVALSQNVSGLTAGTYYRWRLRIKSDSPFFPRTPWFSPPFNGPGEVDVRTAGCLDGDGDGYGAPADLGCAAGATLDCNDGNAATHPGGTEVCDGDDNDCDGTVDGFATSCGVGQCRSTGLCTAGIDSCAPGAPSPESCDNLDNDCDGTRDGFVTSCGVGQCVSEGFCSAGVDSCAPGAPVPEACNGLDDDCDGAVPAGEADADGDLIRACAGDCNDADPTAWTVPVEIQDLQALLPTPATQRLVWEDQAPRAGWSTVYDIHYGVVWGGAGPGDFSSGSCLSESQPYTYFDITGLAPPSKNQILYFMLRAQNTCPGGTSSYGTPNRDTTAAASASPCL